MFKSKKTLIITISILAVIIVIFSFCMVSYNGLVSAEKSVEEAYSNISTQLQRRNDLIPNLVETVKGYAAHEKSAIDSVTEARAAMMGAKSLDEISNSNNQLSSALGRLFAITENYPDLKANQNFKALQDQLEGTENRIAQHRVKYNEKVKEYNQSIKMFPTLIIANLFNFKQKSFFEASKVSEQVPDVQF